MLDIILLASISLLLIGILTIGVWIAEPKKKRSRLEKYTGISLSLGSLAAMLITTAIGTMPNIASTL